MSESILVSARGSRLDWYAFHALFFPQTRRHAYVSLKAYEAYLDAWAGGAMTELTPTPGSLEAWENEGGPGQAERPSTSNRLA